MTSTIQAADRVAPAAREHRLLHVVRGHPLGAFLLWFFSVGQAIAFLPVVAPWLFGIDLPTGPFIVAATFLGLLLPSVVITRLADGPEGLRSLWRRTVRVRVPARWYAVALIGVPLVAAGMSIAVTGAPARLTASALASALIYGFVLQLVVVFLSVNWWEELAWMGFVQARLQERHGAMRAAVITGAVFGLGHVSLAFEDGQSGVMATLALLIAVGIPFRALMAWIYNRTGGSLLLVGLVHAAANAVALGSVLGDGLLPRLYEGAPSGLVFPVLALMGLVAIAATRARLGHGAQARSHDLAAAAA